MVRLLLAGAAIVAAAGCGDRSGAPTEEQDRQLNEASRMLDEAPDSLSGIDDSALNAANTAGTESPAERR